MNVERPPVETVGHAGEWRLPAEGDRTYVVRGRFLGMGTSQRPDHTHDGPRPRGRCPACRWFEVRIFWDDERREYVVYKVGVSVVPGETDRPSVDTSPSPYTVMEMLTTRHSRHASRASSDPRVAACRVVGLDPTFWANRLRGATLEEAVADARTIAASLPRDMMSTPDPDAAFEESRGDDQPKLSVPAARALSTAAGFDEGIEKVWVDRAVV